MATLETPMIWELVKFVNGLSDYQMITASSIDRFNTKMKF